MAQHNEQRACGCRVYQETLGAIRWNRLEYCSKHSASQKLVDALELFVHAYEISVTPEKLSGNLNSIVIDKARAALAASRGQR